MKVNMYNMNGKKLEKKADLPAKVFEAPINTDLMHQAFVRQMANKRQGTKKTKNRSEVSGGGHKPWRQKGTGRARQGTTRAPQWVGGGRAFGVHPRDFSKKMPRKMRQAALRSALSVKASENEIVVVDEIALKEAKTKLMAKSLEKLVGDSSALVVLPNKEEAAVLVARSTQNLPTAKTLQADYLNIRDLLGYDKVIVSLDSIKTIEGYLG